MIWEVCNSSQATRIVIPHTWWWGQRSMSVGCQGSGVFCQPRAYLVWMETCGIRITAFRDCGRRVEWKCVNHQVSVHAHGNERCLCTAQDTERHTSCLFPRSHLSDGSQQQTNNLPRSISLFDFFPFQSIYIKEVLNIYIYIYICPKTTDNFITEYFQ